MAMKRLDRFIAFIGCVIAGVGIGALAGMVGGASTVGASFAGGVGGLGVGLVLAAWVRVI